MCNMRFPVVRHCQIRRGSLRMEPVTARLTCNTCERDQRHFERLARCRRHGGQQCVNLVRRAGKPPLARRTAGCPGRRSCREKSSSTVGGEEQPAQTASEQGREIVRRICPTSGTCSLISGNVCMARTVTDGQALLELQDRSVIERVEVGSNAVMIVGSVGSAQTAKVGIRICHAGSLEAASVPSPSLQMWS